VRGVSSKRFPVSLSLLHDDDVDVDDSPLGHEGYIHFSRDRVFATGRREEQFQRRRGKEAASLAPGQMKRRERSGDGHNGPSSFG